MLSGYRMVDAPGNPALRRELAGLSDRRLEERLRWLKGSLHNVTDLENRERIIRAIEIAEAEKANPPPPAPDVRPLVIGVRYPKNELHRRIRARLDQRLRQGMIEEVQALRDRGVGWERLYALGLEYRLVAERLQGRIKNRNDLFQKLYSAIRQFAKRQGTWFRRMERAGIEIHWIDRGDPDGARRLVSKTSWFHREG